MYSNQEIQSEVCRPPQNLAALFLIPISGTKGGWKRESEKLHQNTALCLSCGYNLVVTAQGSQTDADEIYNGKLKRDGQ